MPPDVPPASLGGTGKAEMLSSIAGFCSLAMPTTAPKSLVIATLPSTKAFRKSAQAQVRDSAGEAAR